VLVTQSGKTGVYWQALSDELLQPSMDTIDPLLALGCMQEIPELWRERLILDMKHSVTQSSKIVDWSFLEQANPRA
jgi:hypothetical protein